MHQAHATQQTLNFAAYQLHLADMRWERLALRETHRRFVIEKSTRWREVGRQLLGSNYDLFFPPEEACRPTNVPHAAQLENCLPAEGLGTQVHQIDIQGVRVHFDPSFNELRVRFEGAVKVVRFAAGEGFGNRVERPRHGLVSKRSPSDSRLDVSWPGGVLQRLATPLDGLISSLQEFLGEFMEAFGGGKFLSFFAGFRDFAPVGVSL